MKKKIAFHMPGILLSLTHKTNAGKLYEDSGCFLGYDVVSLVE
jgi:hypothetical protein